jgi:prepilin-type N-terminal cleavage/methylation domain-containing protein
MRMRSKAFTLLEIMVSVVVLAIVVIIVNRIVSSTSTLTTLGNKRMDSDSQIRPIFDRMAADFAQMIKRADIDSYIKGLDPETGNDRIAFFSQVSGYYPSPTYKSPISLVAYRINGDSNSNSYNKMERMGKGLMWNGVSSTYKALVFGATPTLQANWPAATDNITNDSDYELIGPQVFRFEYFYMKKDGTLANSPGGPGMQDVAAICATIATIDPKSRVLLSDSQVTTLIGQLKDADSTQPIYDLTTSWQSTLDAITNLPRPAITGIRIYQRTFYLWSAK